MHTQAPAERSLDTISNAADNGMAHVSLTPKQTAFVRAYFITGNSGEAYRSAYAAGSISEAAVRVEASRLLRHPNVTLILQA